MRTSEIVRVALEGHAQIGVVHMVHHEDINANLLKMAIQAKQDFPEYKETPLLDVFAAFKGVASDRQVDSLDEGVDKKDEPTPGSDLLFHGTECIVPMKNQKLDIVIS